MVPLFIAHILASSSTSRIANRFRYCILKCWIRHIFKKLLLTYLSWYPSFPFPFFFWHIWGTILPAAGCLDTLFEQIAWISSCVKLISCLSGSWPRIRSACCWSGGLREIFQAVSSPAAGEHGWLLVWQQKSSPCFVTGCFGSPRRYVYLPYVSLSQKWSKDSKTSCSW